MSKLEFSDPKEKEDVVAGPAPPEPEKPGGQKPFKTEGETVSIIIPDAHGYTGVVELAHPDPKYVLGERNVYLKRNERIDVDKRLLVQLDGPYVDAYEQDTDERGNPIGELKKVRKKLYPYHIVG